MDRNASLFTPVLIVGCVIILVSFAVRASFGVFQIPIADEFGWLRAEFSLAIAIFGNSCGLWCCGHGFWRDLGDCGPRRIG